MFQPTVKFEKSMWERVAHVAAAAGYSSPQEFVRHIVQRELSRLETATSKEELIQKLKGLGYLE